MEPTNEIEIELGDDLLKRLKGKQTEEMLNALSGISSKFDLAIIRISLTDKGIGIDCGTSPAYTLLSQLSPSASATFISALKAAAVSPALREVANAAHSFAACAADHIPGQKGGAERG